MATGGTLLCGDENTQITSVVTSSTEVTKDALFVPLIGERVDAHQFIAQSIQKGACAVFVMKPKEEIYYDPAVCYIQVENTLKALQDLAFYYRNRFPLPVIGITGSVGKTTTKEMIAAALETKYEVLKTAGNMNSQVGLALTMFGIERKHQVAVIEMGMSEEGEIAKLAKIARPRLAVITNIGVSHIEQLGSRENIRKEKLNIINEFSHDKDCYLYVNEADNLLNVLPAYQSELQQPEHNCIIDLNYKTKEALKDCHLLIYGINGNGNFKATDVTIHGDGMKFIYHYPEGACEVSLQVLGEHNVMNAVVALSIAYQLGIEVDIAKRGLEEYLPIAMRGQVYKKDGVTIIDDTYNASPDSMKSGLNVLCTVSDSTRRIAVLGDVLELGKVSHDCHYEVGMYIDQLSKNGMHVDEVLTVGKGSRAIVEAIVASNSNILLHCFKDNWQIIRYLKQTLSKGDAVLVKGSRGMHMDEIVKELI